MEPQENGTQSDDPAQVARREERLVALYMELTGASASQARNVYAHLDPDDSPEPDGEHAWTDSSIGPSTPLPEAASERGDRVSRRGKLQGNSGLFEPGTAPALSATGGGR